MEQEKLQKRIDKIVWLLQINTLLYSDDVKSFLTCFDDSDLTTICDDLQRLTTLWINNNILTNKNAQNIYLILDYFRDQNKNMENSELNDKINCLIRIVNSASKCANRDFYKEQYIDRLGTNRKFNKLNFDQLPYDIFDKLISFIDYSISLDSGILELLLLEPEVFKEEKIEIRYHYVLFSLNYFYHIYPYLFLDSNVLENALTLLRANEHYSKGTEHVIQLNKYLLKRLSSIEKKQGIKQRDKQMVKIWK